MKDQETINKQIRIAEMDLERLEAKRTALKERIKQLKGQKQSISNDQPLLRRPSVSNITNESTQEQKIALFRALFRGREDVYPRRFESKRTGKSGYQPACRNEWIRPICQKPKIKCGDCENRDFIPLSDDVIRNHLIGLDPVDRYRREFVIGVYPMLPDETCWFLAVDLDKKTWQEDARIYMETCQDFNVPAVLERSRSGHGGHVWIFFSEAIPAKLARQLGAFMLTQAMESRPEMGFDSYDRFFPSQDTFIFMNCGPVRYKVDDKKQAAARPFEHRVVIRKTNFRMPASFAADKYTAIHEIYKALMQNGERNLMIVDDVMNAIKSKRFPVILTERKEHLETLKGLLENKVQNLIVMRGGMGKKQRQDAIDALASLPDDAEKAVLATGRYLGEGFDDERLDTLLLTLPISWKGTLSQYAGRLHRIHDTKKKVVIYDYFDFKVPILERMHGKRIRGYKSIGYELVDNAGAED